MIGDATQRLVGHTAAAELKRGELRQRGRQEKQLPRQQSKEHRAQLSGSCVGKKDLVPRTEYV
jgi:hypothetical protein